MMTFDTDPDSQQHFIRGRNCRASFLSMQFSLQAADHLTVKTVFFSNIPNAKPSFRNSGMFS